MNKLNQFILETLGSGNTRIGYFEIAAGGGVTLLQTPAFLIHTLSGSIPHVTSEVADMVFNLGSQAIQISIDTTYTFHENVKPSGYTISKFVGFPKIPSFLTIHNPLRELLPGFNDRSGISVWTRMGRRTLDISKFIQIVNDFQPTFFQVLSDYDVSVSSSVKRIRKSTSRNLEYLNEVIQKIDSSARSAFGTIEVSWFLVSPLDAEIALTHMLEKQHDFNGFILNGVKTSGKINPINISNIIAKLPENKPRFTPGEFKLWEIMDLVRSGVDLFDSSVVTRVSEEGQVFSLQLEKLNHSKATATPDLPSNESIPAKSNQINGDFSSDNENFSAAQLVLNLREKQYFGDFSPISTTCNCYTCRKYTRAYLHHLLCTSELLGPVLLMMHNLDQFEKFFQAVRQRLPDEQKFAELYEYLKSSDATQLPISVIGNTTTEVKNDDSPVRRNAARITNQKLSTIEGD